MTNTCRCGAALSEGTTLCPRCVRTLDVALVNVAAHHLDLGTLRTKRTRYGSGAATKGSIGKTRPIGVDLRFVAPSDARGRDQWQIPGREGEGTTLDRTVRASLLLWVARAAGTWPNLTQPSGTVSAQCTWLGGILTAIAGQDWAGALVDDMLGLERKLARLVDRPPERWYAGKCSAQDPSDPDGSACTYELYASEESGTIRCRACGTEHDVADRRDFLLEEAKGYHVTATEAASALIAWTDYDGSEKKLVDLIWSWRDRGKLEVADVTSLHGKDRHLYRLGDIQELLVRHAQRIQRRRLGHSA